MSSSLSRCSYLLALGVALTPLLINYQVFAVTCNGKVPESPAPTCGTAASTCEQIVSAGCPLVANCMNTQGIYREKVPKDCQPGTAKDHCVWSATDTLCSTSKSCKKNGAKCTAVATCATADDSFKTTGPCDPPEGG